MLVRSGLWRRMDGAGLERFELRRAGEDWVLRGTLLLARDTGPVEARYEVVCDAGWRTRRTDVALRDAQGERMLALTVEDGRWYAEGHEFPAVRGCVDVDLEWSPFTNTLPIRRVGPATGARTGSLRMAWVRFPSLALQPLEQEYTRTGDHRYHYASGGGSFQSEIEVDDEGLVVRYRDGWERVGP